MPTKRKDIDIIFSRSDDGYSVKVQNQEGGGEREGAFLPPIKVPEVINGLRLARSREIKAKGFNWSDPEKKKIKGLGSGFFKSLSSYLEHFLPKAGSTDNARLRFKFNKNVPELAKWPWEYLYNHNYFCLQRHTPIVRYIEFGEITRALQLNQNQLPLKILFVAANSPRYRQLDLAKELAEIKKTLEGFGDKVKYNTLIDNEATSQNLLQKLEEEKYHVLHFMGHGTFDANEEKGYLQLFDEPLEDEVLKTWIADHRSLKMVFLNACRGAQSDGEDIFTGMAHSIVEIGVPAVIAMQFAISDEAAIAFSTTFYQKIIGEETDLEDAVTAGRKVLQRKRATRLEWGTPALFLRTINTSLFDTKLVESKTPKKNVFSPEFLPYLLNRHKQIQDIENALDKFKNKPLVCVVHGYKDQCMDKFIERLKERDLPKAQNIKKEKIKYKWIRWPAEFRNNDDIVNGLRRNLSGELLGARNHSLAEIKSGSVPYLPW